MEVFIEKMLLLTFLYKMKVQKTLQQLVKTNVVSRHSFDRVATILEKDNTLDFIAQFKDNTVTIVVGSSWPKDEDFIELHKSTALNVKFIIAQY
jgi:3-deoxy-D-manno-octulosonic-acid transferase